MRTVIASLCAACAIGFAPDSCAAEEPSDKDPISKYLVDVDGGSVAAASLISLDKSAVTTIQRAQDLAVVLKPFGGDKESAGFGMSITPARTELIPVSGRSYYENPLVRLGSNLTLSYAQNDKDVGEKKYKQYAYSLDTHYYFERDQDPSVLFSVKWKDCADSNRESNNKKLGEFNAKYPPGKLTDAARKELQAVTEERRTLLGDCARTAMKAAQAWNAARISVSLGGGRIAANSGGQKYTLGRRFAVNGLVGVGPGAINVTVQRVQRALDLESLKTTPDFKSSTLAGIRYTFPGSTEDSRTRFLVELSNARSSSTGVFNEAFIYAMGFDYRIYDLKDLPIWLSLRAGKNRSIESGKEQTTVLLNLRLQRNSSLPVLPTE